MVEKDPSAKVGMRIRNIMMTDNDPIDEGMEGTIIKIDDLGTLHVKWDDGRTLGVIPGVDTYELLSNEVVESKDFKPSKETKKNPIVKKINTNFKTSLKKGKVTDIKVESESKKISIKDEVQRIVDTIKTAKPIHKKSLENMVSNLNNKYKNVKKDEDKFRDLISSLYQKINDKLGVDETTTAGSSGAYVGNLNNKLQETTTTNSDKTEGIFNSFVWVDKNKNERLSDGDENIEEVTTVSSVWGSNGPPVTPMFAAKKGKHGPSKKTLWKGGKFVQKVKSDDSLVSEKSTIVNELNKVKWVKNGKFVKIKDRCAKYNNKPWCSQGAIDNPLEFSDTTFENITNISEKTGLSEEYIYNLLVKEVNSGKKD